ncbi:AAA family ATPase [Pseudomonas putida]|uniref:AAA family ATPase n=1 Tax=Pseudomonas putida TaxID=303 RepID=UPI0015E19BA8|nr:AAA family ATPase [Pseudomonas putida]
MSIFVAGAHGSGKTTVCMLLSELLGVDHYSASSLIIKHSGRANWSSAKTTNSIQENQLALVIEINNLRQHNPRFLLDGHFTLLNSKKEIEPVSFSILKALNFNGAIIVESTAESIYKRISERDKELWSPKLISRMITAEHEHAIIFAKLTQTPIIFIQNDTPIYENHELLCLARKWLNLN